MFCLGEDEIVYDRGRYFDDMFLVSHCLLIYIYEIIHDICLYFMFCEIKNLFCFTYIFHTCVYAFVECLRNIQVDLVMLLSTLAIDR